MWSCVILMLSACTAALCQGKGIMAEADLCGLASGKAIFGIEYGISEHWSAGGTVELGFSHFIKGPSTLESGHTQEFGDSTSYPIPTDPHKENIHFRYWPAETMKGPYAMAGIAHGSISGTDFCIGTGYIMHIWKSLNIYFEYNIGLKEAIRMETFPVRGLTAGICLTFRLQ